jgi:hypothetical protein
MIVFVEEAAEAIASADTQTGKSRGIGDRFGQRTQRPGVRDAPMRTMIVVVPPLHVFAAWQARRHDR